MPWLELADGLEHRALTRDILPCQELTQRVKVRPDGKITVPLVNDVLVAGLTTNQVRDKIATALGTFIREPHVTVIVEAIQSYRVYFLGEIQRQGALNFYRPTRLLQGIAAAGGLTQYAEKEVVLLREVRGEEKRISVDYKRLLAGVETEQNVYLLAGDTVLVR